MRPHAAHRLTQWLVVAGFAVWIAGCATPQGDLKHARNTHRRTDYNRLLERFPQSPEAKLAQTDLVELTAWERAATSNDTSLVTAFLALYPNGLLRDVALRRRVALTDFQQASLADSAAEWRRFVAQHDDSALVARARARIKELDAASAICNALPPTADLARLRHDYALVRSTPMARQVWRRLEAVTLPSVLAGVKGAARYHGIAPALDSLATRPAQQVARDPRLLVRQAMEDVRIAELNAIGEPPAFALPAVLVHEKCEGHRFSFREPGSGDGSATCYFSGTVHNGLPRGLQVSRIEAAVGPAVLCTEYPDDRFPFDASALGGMSMFGDTHMWMEGTGKQVVARLDPLQCSAGSVWRFHGTHHIVPGVIVRGDPDDPLTFYLTSKWGAVYLAGRGVVTDCAGVPLFSAAD